MFCAESLISDEKQNPSVNVAHGYKPLLTWSAFENDYYLVCSFMNMLITKNVTWLFPVPAPPTTNTECLTASSSSSWVTFRHKNNAFITLIFISLFLSFVCHHWKRGIPICHREEDHIHFSTMFKWETLSMKFSSGCRCSSPTDLRTVFSSSGSLFLGTSSWGNRSLINPRNIGTSLVTILGKLKSLSARIKTWGENEKGIVMSQCKSTQTTIHIIVDSCSRIL